MRTPVLFLLLAAVISGCVLLDNGLDGHLPRMDTTRRGRDSTAHSQSTDPQWLPVARPDTILYYTAVRFPKGYDWQRDSAYGHVDFELLLYRDSRPLLTLEYGPEAPFCADPDRHHILSGHLYTERMSGSETRIGKDGEELFRFDGREFLVGLLADGDDLYTLSRTANGKGFSYRKNGQILLTRTEGTPFGSMSDPSYGPGGALYRENGQVVFCFRSGYITSFSHYLVRDGVETRLDSILPGQNILDIKLHGDQIYTLQPSFFKSLLYEGRIWPEEQGYSVTGRFSDGRGGTFSGLLAAGEWTVQQTLCAEEASIYYDPQGACAVAAGADGSVRWYMPAGSGSSDGACHFFSAACATLMGKRFVLALNPKDSSRSPVIRDGTRVRELDLYGYVSRVSLELSLPN